MSTKALRQDLGTRHLQVVTSPDLSGRTSWRRQSRTTEDLRLCATKSQIWLSSAWTKPAARFAFAFALWLCLPFEMSDSWFVSLGEPVLID
eukprot:7299152-Prymnesium_polylepis.1